MQQPPATALRIAENRKATKYTRKEQLARVAWTFGAIAFRLVPQPLYGLRSSLLRLFGARMGAQCHISRTVRIFAPWALEVGDFTAVGDRAILYNLGSITLGERVTISQRAHLCAGTHRFREASMPLVRAAITVEDDAWVCADAFIGPDVTIGSGAVVGARAVAMKNVAGSAIVAGNPARIIGSR
jgi:putative colanic acid biosynthesis acetyltransferase WcaF